MIYCLWDHFSNSGLKLEVEVDEEVTIYGKKDRYRNSHSSYHYFSEYQNKQKTFRDYEKEQKLVEINQVLFFYKF